MGGLRFTCFCWYTGMLQWFKLFQKRKVLEASGKWYGAYYNIYRAMARWKDLNWVCIEDWRNSEVDGEHGFKYHRAEG
ncbi:hypothetical protein VTP01DRAFT_6246 [Rhizomucor pusillus]|uniref:uncharacterized protein n=1 Tax=Rhizomucor pusillus TaxID=4840 RepID=UPI003741F421